MIQQMKTFLAVAAIVVVQYMSLLRVRGRSMTLRTFVMWYWVFVLLFSVFAVGVVGLMKLIVEIAK